MTTSEVLDPFNTQRGPNQYNDFRYNVTYINIQYYPLKYSGSNVVKKDNPHWVTFSYGPDRVKGPNPINGDQWPTNRYARIPPAPHEDDDYFTLWNYDSTNGSKSNGDILRWG